MDTSFDSTNLENQSNLRRYQLLRYRDVMRLCDVMETVVPIHGTGNFPTLDIEPYRLVQVNNLLYVIRMIKRYCQTSTFNCNY